MIETSEKYFNLMSALAYSVMDMSDEEIEEEIAESGDTAEETRNLLLNAIEFAIPRTIRNEMRIENGALLSITDEDIIDWTQ